MQVAHRRLLLQDGVAMNKTAFTPPVLIVIDHDRLQRLVRAAAKNELCLLTVTNDLDTQSLFASLHFELSRAAAFPFDRSASRRFENINQAKELTPHVAITRLSDRTFPTGA